MAVSKSWTLRDGGFLVPALAIAVVVLAGLALWLFVADRPPADDSAEAEFAHQVLLLKRVFG